MSRLVLTRKVRERHTNSDLTASNRTDINIYTRLAYNCEYRSKKSRRNLASLQAVKPILNAEIAVYNAAILFWPLYRPCNIYIYLIL